MQPFRFSKTLLKTLSVASLIFLWSPAGGRATQIDTDNVIELYNSGWTKMRIYPQDPSVIFDEGQRFQEILFTSKNRVASGLEDKFFKLTERHKVKPDAGGNYLFEPGTENFDLTHTFASLKLVADLHGQTFRSLTTLFPYHEGLKAAHKKWENLNGFKKTVVEPFDLSDTNNAYYSRDEYGNREIRFFPISYEGKRGFTCRSSDIVIHEGTHWATDNYREDFFTSDSLQTGAFHEANADLGAIFTLMSQPSLCEIIMEETGGNLRKGSFLPYVAEQLGDAFGSGTGLRNLGQKVSVNEVDMEVHSLSRVFSSAYYDYFVYKVETQMDLEEDHYLNNLGLLLYDVAKDFWKAHQFSIVEVKGPNPSFNDFIENFINAEVRMSHQHQLSSKNVKKEMVAKPFEDRGLIGGDSKNFYEKAKGMKAKSLKSICGTSFKLAPSKSDSKQGS